MAGGEYEHQPPALANTTSDDLSRDVSISVKLDGAGLGLKAKSRALAAVDSLVGDLVGWGGAYIRGNRIIAETKKAIQQERLIDDYQAERAVRRLATESVKKQENREAVWQEAEQILLSSPVNEKAAQTDTAAQEESAPSVEDNEVFDDWMNIFGSYAEKASSETMRRVWARVLSDEIRKQGSFSPSALRIVSELDAKTAKSFQEIVENRISGKSFGLNSEVVLKPEPLENEMLELWTGLQEAGLLQEVNGNLHGSKQLSDGEQYMTIVDGDLALMVTKKNSAVRISFPLVMITRAGSQIAAILPKDRQKSLKAFAAKVGEDVTVQLMVVTSFDGGRLSCYPIEKIK